MPGVCGGCQSGYILNSITSTCHLDCSSNDVRNCYACSNLHLCTSCNQGYHLAFAGTKCYLDCTVAHCIICSPAATCTFCAQGYKVSAGSCIADACSIEYCNNCNSSTTCGTCSTPFIVNSGGTACLPSCSSSLSNCLLCSVVTSTLCDSCQPGYRLATVSTNITTC